MIVCFRFLKVTGAVYADPDHIVSAYTKEFPPRRFGGTRDFEKNTQIRCPSLGWAQNDLERKSNSLTGNLLEEICVHRNINARCGREQ
jgi:hypothetical protein